MIATAVKYAGQEFSVGPEPADFWGWVEEGRYDSEWRALQAHLRPEQTFIDLGAWVGSHSLLASRIAKRIVAVEPDPIAHKILGDNLCQNGIKALAFQAAISDKSGRIELGSEALGWSTTRANPIAGSGIGESKVFFTAPSLTLPELIEIAKITGPMFIKMDIEGSEEQVLADLDFFRLLKPTLYIELHPFWWHKEPETWMQLAILSGMYGKTLDRHGNPAQAGARELIFVD